MRLARYSLVPIIVLLVLLLFLACASPAERVQARASPTANVDSGEEKDDSPRADRVEVVKGVPNRGRDPAVLAIEIGGELCSGVLISPRLVLTARHCVSKTAKQVICPAKSVQVLSDHPPSSILVRVGEDIVSARPAARGQAIVAPAGVTLCGADIAVLVLDNEITTVKPLPVRARGPAYGDRVRAVGFGRPNDEDPPGTKLVREHVRVLSVSSSEFNVGEAVCSGDSGGPALDEDTGEIVGVVSRGGPSCEGAEAYNIYTRVDAYAWLVEEAFARVSELVRLEKLDAGASNPELSPAKRGTKSKPPSDVGGPCERGEDCAAGICILEGARRYCSRPCGPGDRCPTRYHCKSVATYDETGESPEEVTNACINVR